MSHILQLQQVQFIPVPVVVCQVVQVVFSAEIHDQIPCSGEITPGQGWEEMVLDLVVQTTPEPVGEFAGGHVSRGEDLESGKVVQDAGVG